MRTRRRVLLLVALALIVAVGAAAAVGLRSRGGPPALLVRALEVMPPAAEASGLYFASQPGTLESVYGFAPGRAEASVEQAYAIRGQDIVAVLESGGAASTVLAGRINAEPSVGSGPDALVLEPQQPRWDAAAGVATVDVTASGPPQAWAQLRSRIEAGEAGFLRQP